MTGPSDDLTDRPADEAPLELIESGPPEPATTGRSLFVWAVSISAFCLAVQTSLAWLARRQPENFTPIVLGSLALGVFISIVPAWLIRRTGERVFDGPRDRRLSTELLVAAGWLLVMFPVLILIASLLQDRLLAEDDPHVTQFEQLQTSGNVVMWALFVLAACIWAPIFEEIAFRRFVFRGLESRWGTAVAIVASSAVFAAMHSYGLIRTFMIFGVGLVLCSVYAVRRTLVTPMILHALFNGTMLALVFGQAVLSDNAPALGVSGEQRPDGFLVHVVSPDLPAGVAGVRPGDLLVELNDQPVHTVMQVRAALILSEVGDEVSGVVIRNGQHIPMTFKLTHTMKEVRDRDEGLEMKDEG
jgi:membrane protease YdiL (CAAX protease family)